MVLRKIQSRVKQNSYNTKSGDLSYPCKEKRVTLRNMSFDEFPSVWLSEIKSHSFE